MSIRPDFPETPEIPEKPKRPIVPIVVGGITLLGLILLLLSKIFSPSNSCIDCAAHSAGTGNLLTIDESSRGLSPDIPLKSNKSVYEVKKNMIDLKTFFYIKLGCDVRKKEGDVTGSLSFFRNKVKVKPDKIEIKIFNNSVTQNTTVIDINSDDYYPGAIGFCPLPLKRTKDKKERNH